MSEKCLGVLWGSRWALGPALAGRGTCEGIGIREPAKGAPGLSPKRQPGINQKKEERRDSGRENSMSKSPGWGERVVYTGANEQIVGQNP